MVISHNLMAMNAQRQFNVVNRSKAKSTEKLSSGYRINRAADDAAGLAISEKMRRQIRGINQGISNVQDGISLVQVADGALSEVHDILQRANELAVKAANGTNTDQDRAYIQDELQSMSDEIDRIGKSTSFNDMLILDDAFGVETEGSVTTLVKSNAAETGYLTDSIKVGSYYFPAAKIDFSGINQKNIGRLNGQGFSFNCSRGCSEVFDIKFVTDGTAGSATNLDGKVHHYYTIDISSCTSGSDVVSTIYNYVAANLPTNNSPESVNKLSGALGVSHSNYMIQTDGGSSLTIYANTRIVAYGSYSYIGYATAEEAENAYPSTAAGVVDYAGKIDCTELTKIVSDELENDFNIQCSSNVDDCLTVKTHRVNSSTLGILGMSVGTADAAKSTIDTVKSAMAKVSSYRSELGAYQNRLEHTSRNLSNISENTQAAESAIRDTDMADEMVDYSMKNILEQAGVSMMSQANQSNQLVLSLLQ